MNMFISKKEFSKSTILPDYLKDYSMLPDSMTKSEVKNEFEEFFNSIDKSVLLWKFDQLYELANRQFYSWEKIDSKTACKVENFILQNIDYECYDIMESACSIICYLGLKNLFDTIYSNLANIKNELVKKLLIETKQEEYNDLENPYSRYTKKS